MGQVILYCKPIHRVPVVVLMFTIFSSILNQSSEESSVLIAKCVAVRVLRNFKKLVRRTSLSISDSILHCTHQWSELIYYEDTNNYLRVIRHKALELAIQMSRHSFQNIRTSFQTSIQAITMNKTTTKTKTTTNNNDQNNNNDPTTTNNDKTTNNNDQNKTMTQTTTMTKTTTNNDQNNNKQ